MRVLSEIHCDAVCFGGVSVALCVRLCLCLWCVVTVTYYVMMYGL